MNRSLSRFFVLALLIMALLTVLALPAGAAVTSTTDFESFSTGSVNYQGPGGTINTGFPGILHHSQSVRQSVDSRG